MIKALIHTRNLGLSEDRLLLLLRARMALFTKGDAIGSYGDHRISVVALEYSPIQDYAMKSKHLHAVLESKEGILVLCITCLVSTGPALLHPPKPGG